MVIVVVVVVVIVVVFVIEVIVNVVLVADKINGQIKILYSIGKWRDLRNQVISELWILKTSSSLSQSGQ